MLGLYRVLKMPLGGAGHDPSKSGRKQNMTEGHWSWGAASQYQLRPGLPTFCRSSAHAPPAPCSRPPARHRADTLSISAGTFDTPTALGALAIACLPAGRPLLPPGCFATASL